MSLENTLAPLAAMEARPQRAPAITESEFAAFHQRTWRPLWAYLTRAGGDAALAEDLAQEAYLRFLQAARWSEGELACRRYLFTIATNLLRDHQRRRRVLSLEDVHESCLPPGASLAGLEARLDSGARLEPAWRRLRLRDRQLLWLAYIEGCTHREIAAITGLAPASIRLLLFRARRRLLAHLEAPR